MEELGQIDERAASADIFVPLFSKEHTGAYLGLAEELRRSGLSVELYPDSRKLGAQMKYADRRGHRLAVIIGGNEWDAGTAQIKNLDTGESIEVAQQDLAAQCARLLESPVGEGH